jgi:hypothetical protein
MKMTTGRESAARPHSTKSGSAAPGPHQERSGEDPATTPAASGLTGGVLDAAPIIVLADEPAAPANAAGPMAEAEPAAEEPPGNNVRRRRRRASIPLITATGVVALAAAPFVIVSPHEHLAGEDASAPAAAHHPHAGKKSAPETKVVVPAPSWGSRDPFWQPPATQPPADPPVTTDPAPVDPTGAPVGPSPADPAPGANTPEKLPANVPASDPQRAPDSPSSPAPEASPTLAPAPVRRHRTSRAAPAMSHAVRREARPASAKPATPQWRSLVVHGTYVLKPGQDVHTNRLRLALQTDGDLVLRDQQGTAVWSTGAHANVRQVVFQADGNFVLYSTTNATLWSSRTDGHDGAVLVLQADGDLAITQGGTVLWHTGTAR